MNRLNLNALIRRKERILKKSYRIRHVLMLKDVKLMEAMLLLDYDQFHIIHIADRELDLIKEITEKQLMDAILEKSSDITLEEAFMKSRSLFRMKRAKWRFIAGTVICVPLSFVYKRTSVTIPCKP